MKRLLLFVVLVFVAAGFSYGQDWDDPEIAARLGLDEEAIEQIRAIF